MKSFQIALWGVIFIVHSACGFAESVKPKYGPKGRPEAVPLALSREYFRSPEHQAPDFWALIGYYVPQINGASCSAASIAMVMNAARSTWALSAEDRLITQSELLEKLEGQKDLHWKQRLSAGGFQGEHGLTLDLLGKATEAAFQAYGFKQVAVKVVHVLDSSPGTKKAIHEILKQNEKSTQDFVIANFNQQTFTDDSAVGHISPVAAYDETAQKVLILDPDRDYYEPYWVSLETFVRGMATRDASAQLNRGLVVIRINASAS